MHLGGALALWNVFPTLTAAQIKRALVQSGIDNGKWSSIAGGIMNLDRAYAIAELASTGTNPTPPPASPRPPPPPPADSTCKLSGSGCTRNNQCCSGTCNRKRCA